MPGLLLPASAVSSLLAEFEKRIRTELDDPLLCVLKNPFNGGKVEIHRYHEQRPRDPNHRALIYVVEDDRGEFRMPDGRDIERLQLTDLRRRGAHTEQDRERLRRRAEQARQARIAEITAETQEQVHAIARRGGETLDAQVSMYTPKRRTRGKE